MREGFRRFQTGIRRFAEKQGFPIIITVCVAVMTAAALWTREYPQFTPAPAESAENVSAAQLGQQPLRDAATPPPPEITALPFRLPLKDCIVLQPYADHMVQSSVTGLWQIHAAVDLQASPGEEVRAAADGLILSAGESPLDGDWITIDHGGGLILRYSGVKASPQLSAGERVRAGGVIGIVGDSPLDESNLGPHLHLQAFREGISVDPTSLWESQN